MTDAETNVTNAEVNGKEMKAKKEKPKKARVKKGSSKPQKKRSRAAAKNFPGVTFEEALELANAFQQHAAGQRQVRRLTLFGKMNKSPDSGPSRQLIVNSGRYGLTEGGYQAEFLLLTDEGNVASSTEAAPKDQLRARFKLAIERHAPFKLLYEKLGGNKMPSPEFMKDILSESDVPDHDRAECVEVFVANAKFLGLLKTFSGAERLITIEHALEELPADPARPSLPGNGPSGLEGKGDARNLVDVDFSKVCFFVGPIGEDDSEERKHSDMVMSNLLERALEREDLKVVRADQISQPGMISRQITQYILKSRVVVVDMSFHNPNVFYELALRHASGLPTVHLIRQQDKIPFDLANFRTIKIDTADKYNLVAKLDTYRAEIGTQVRQALSDGVGSDNPVRAFHPDFKVSLS